MISKTGDAHHLAQNIMDLDENPTLVKNLVAEGHRTTEEYSDRVMIEKYQRLIESLIYEGETSGASSR